MIITFDYIKNLKNKNYIDITEEDLNTPVIYRHLDRMSIPIYRFSQCRQCNNCYFKLSEIPYVPELHGMVSKCLACGYDVFCYNIIEHKRKNKSNDPFELSSLNRCTVFFPKAILI